MRFRYWPNLLQEEVEISNHDTTGGLYFNKLSVGVDSMIKSIKLVLKNKALKLNKMKTMRHMNLGAQLRKSIGINHQIKYIT